MPVLFWLDVAALSASAVTATALVMILLGSGARRALNRCMSAFTLLEAAWAVLSLLLRLSLWLERGNPTLLLEMATLSFALMGPVLLTFTVRYVGRRTRWVDLAAALGFATIAILAIPLFRHQLLFDPRVAPDGTAYTGISTWGVLASAVPALCFGGSLVLFWRERRRTGEPYLIVSVLVLLLGLAVGGVLEVSFPVLSVTNTVAVAILGYAVVSRQILNPLRDLAAQLGHEVEEGNRRQRVLLALSQAAQAVQRVHTPAKVYRTIADEIAGLGLQATVFTLTDDRAHLALTHTTVNSAAIRVAERVSGLSAQGYTFALAPGGIHEEILRTGRAVVIERVTEVIAETLPRSVRALAGQIAGLLGLSQAIYAPLTVGGETLALLTITGSGLAEADVPAVTAFANQAAIALENARLYEEVQKELAERKQAEAAIRHQAETLAALHETALELGGQRELPDLLQAIVDRATGLLHARGGAVYLHRPNSDDLELVIHSHIAADYDYTGVVLRRGEGLAGKVLDRGQPMAVTDYHHWEGRSDRFEQVRYTAICAVPISWGGRILGILNLTDDVPRTFSQDDIAILERFAPLAAAAMQNTRLLSDLQQQMEQLKNTQTQLIQSAKLAAVGELAAGVAHELNNPLTSVLGYAELLLQDLKLDPPHQQDLETIAAEAQRARAIVRSLLSFARQTKPLRRPGDLNLILQQTLAVIRYYLVKSDIVIEEDYAPDLGFLPLDEGQIKQVFLNLISNAVRTMPEGGTLSVRTARVGDEIAASISDSGEGIRPEIRERIFDPFFTTHPDGTGLGLSVSLGIVQEHGGRITVESQPGKGSNFTVWLPADAPTEGVKGAR